LHYTSCKQRWLILKKQMMEISGIKRALFFSSSSTLEKRDVKNAVDGVYLLYLVPELVAELESCLAM
jgi:hypothetical protein